MGLKRILGRCFAAGASAAILLVGAAVMTSGSPAQATDCAGSGGYRYIQTVLGPDTKVVDVRNRSKDSGANIQLWSKICGSTAYNQLWGLTVVGYTSWDEPVYGGGTRHHDSVPYGYVKNLNSGGCLYSNGGLNGATVYQWTCGGTRTLWRYVLSADHTYALWVSMDGDKCLDIRNQQYVDGNFLQVWTCLQNTAGAPTTYWNQRWVWTP